MAIFSWMGVWVEWRPPHHSAVRLDVLHTFSLALLNGHTGLLPSGRPSVLLRRRDSRDADLAGQGWVALERPAGGAAAGPGK